MEVIEICKEQQKRPQYRPAAKPASNSSYTKKSSKRYIQPARVESYRPSKTYCPPSKPLDAKTTYHLSYLNGTQGERAIPVRPTQSLHTTGAKFEDGTTNRLSFQPIWGVVKAQPILPRRRAFEPQGPMECTTEARQAFSAKVIGEKPKIVVPCGNIRTCTGVLDSTTTSGLSYMHPGSVERTPSFKPQARYAPPQEPTAKDTTQKLSYQPFPVAKKETYPWARKAAYQPPTAALDSQTTYSKSFLSDGIPVREKPFKPEPTITFERNQPFFGKTIYNESFLPCETSHVVPVVPSDNISLPNAKMTTDTTNRLSYQAVRTEKRLPFRPSMRKTLGEGPMQTETTNRHDFVPTSVPKPEVIIPCDNIRSRVDAPLEGHTTSGLSYIDPGPVMPVPSFKPRIEYSKPTAKLESETVNKLSYQVWEGVAKQPSMKPRKGEYELPKEPMVSNTVYNMSFPAPGQYVEDYDTADETAYD